MANRRKRELIISDDDDDDETSLDNLTPADRTNAGNVRKRIKYEKKTGDPARELIVKNLAFRYDKCQLIGLLKKFDKKVEVESIFENGMFTRTAKATFQSSEDAKKAMVLNGQMFFGHELVLERVDYPGNQIADQPFVVVKGLPKEFPKELLRDHFRSCGSPTKVDISSGYKQKYRCAFIRYKSEASIEKALELTGSLFCDQTITVELGKSSGGRSY